MELFFWHMEREQLQAPRLAGFIKTTTGTYIGVFPYVFILALAGLVIGYILMRPPLKKGKIP